VFAEEVPEDWRGATLRPSSRVVTVGVPQRLGSDLFLRSPAELAKGANSVMICAMKLVSVNVGLPREMEWQGKLIRTSIFKSPARGRVRVNRFNLEGDEQSDLSVHGGVDKAVYAYPSEHYAFWRTELPRSDLPWGIFGENLTIEGFSEEAVCIGDYLQIGTAKFVVTQPRLPCYKLGIRLGDQAIVRRFLRSGRTGFYLAVAEEGYLTAGDRIELLTKDEHGVTVADLFSLHTADEISEDLIRRVRMLPALPSFWQDQLKNRVVKQNG
jgi:MOSC domain-containing protein YiiM